MRSWIICSFCFISLVGLSYQAPPGHAADRGKFPDLDYGIKHIRPHSESNNDDKLHEKPEGGQKDRIPLYPVRDGKNRKPQIDDDMVVAAVNLPDIPEIEVPEIPDIEIPKIPEIEIPEVNQKRDIGLDLDTPIGDIDVNIGKRGASDHDSAEFPPIGDGAEEIHPSEDRNKRDIDWDHIGDVDLGYGRDHRSVDESQYPPPREGTDHESIEDGDRHKRDIDIGDIELGYGRDHRSVDMPWDDSIDDHWPPVFGQNRLDRPGPDEDKGEREKPRTDTSLDGRNIVKRDIHIGTYDDKIKNAEQIRDAFLNKLNEKDSTEDLFDKLRVDHQEPERDRRFAVDMKGRDDHPAIGEGVERDE